VADVVWGAVALLAWALVSARARRWPLTMPMVLVAVGVAVSVLGPLGSDVPESTVGLVGEVALAVVLFGDAARIDLGALRREGGLPIRLLLVGLPLSVVLGTGVVLGLLPEVGLAAAALVAAVLAPTDPALGHAVVEDTSVPLRVRQALNVESGLNDGLVLPVVLVLVTLAGGTTGQQESWPVIAAQQVGLGALVGIVVGGVGALVLRRSVEAGWIDGVYTQLATLAVAVMSLAAAEVAGGNAFVSAFVAGLVLGGPTKRIGAQVVDYTEDSGQLLAAGSFFLFGAVLLPGAVEHLSWAVVACAVATLTVGRLVPVAVSLLGSGARPTTVLFMGWFGPRGLASVVFGVLLLEADVPGADTLSAVVFLTVALSVLVHGATAGWGALTYGRWAKARGLAEDDTMEGAAVHEHPTRGRSRWVSGGLA